MTDRPPEVSAAPPAAAPPASGPAARARPAPAPGLPVGEMAIKRGVVRCLVCSIVSLGVYGFFWFHQYRRRVSAELGRTDDAGLHTAGLLVPFLNYYIAYLLWRDIGTARRRVGLSDIPAFGYALASVVAAPIVYCIVASRLNEYWDRRTGGAATGAPFTAAERLVTVVPPVVFLGLIALVVAVAASGS